MVSTHRPMAGPAAARKRAPLVALALSATLAAGCGPLGEDVHDGFNSREIGTYVGLGRALAEDGSLMVHVAASKPENAERIAQHIVRQNYAASPPSIRIVVDPMVGDAQRRVFRWDGRGMVPDTSTEGLPPRATRPDADGAEAAPH